MPIHKMWIKIVFFFLNPSLTLCLESNARASMLCLSLNENDLLTYSTGFSLNFFSPIKILLVHLNLSTKIYVNLWTTTNWDIDDLHPRRDAALL